jgi:hypothetical protein
MWAFFRTLLTKALLIFLVALIAVLLLDNASTNSIVTFIVLGKVPGMDIWLDLRQIVLFPSLVAAAYILTKIGVRRYHAATRHHRVVRRLPA